MEPQGTAASQELLEQAPAATLASAGSQELAATPGSLAPTAQPGHPASVVLQGIVAFRESVERLVTQASVERTELLVTVVFLERVVLPGTQASLV
jgi:hypothetical protein